MSQSTLAVCLRGQERSGFASSLRFMSCHPHEAMIRSISLTPQTPWNYRVFLAYLRWYSNIRSQHLVKGNQRTAMKNAPRLRIFVYQHGWYLCGFGTVVLAAFYVPFLGLVLYHTFQRLRHR